MPDTDKPLPFLSAAVLCEKVLQESNGSLTLVRLADRVDYDLSLLPAGVQPVMAIQGLISVKSGPAVGAYKLKVVGINPKGQSHQLIESVFTLKGNDQGQNLILNLTLLITGEGLHWFDVFIEDHLMTRIPLMLVPVAKPLIQGLPQQG